MEAIKIKDRQVQYPNRFRLAAVSGQENVYDITPVPGTVTQAGTALNKANLLSDATAALLGLSGDSTVDGALALIANKARHEEGSYTGTGDYGSANPNTLSFSFAPKIVIIQSAADSKYGPLFIQAGVSTTYCKQDGSGSATTVNWSNGGKTLNWYTTSSQAAYQLNSNGHNYNYIAFG